MSKLEQRVEGLAKEAMDKNAIDWEDIKDKIVEFNEEHPWVGPGAALGGGVGLVSSLGQNYRSLSGAAKTMLGNTLGGTGLGAAGGYIFPAISEWTAGLGGGQTDREKAIEQAKRDARELSPEDKKKVENEIKTNPIDSVGKIVSEYDGNLHAAAVHLKKSTDMSDKEILKILEPVAERQAINNLVFNTVPDVLMDRLPRNEESTGLSYYFSPADMFYNTPGEMSWQEYYNKLVGPTQDPILRTLVNPPEPDPDHGPFGALGSAISSLFGGGESGGENSKSKQPSEAQKRRVRDAVKETRKILKPDKTPIDSEGNRVKPLL